MITRRKTTLALLSTGGLTFLSAGWARAASDSRIESITTIDASGYTDATGTPFYN
jgi:hypothetical protein